MSIYSEVINDLHKFGVYPDKRFSQNFLIDGNIIQKLINISKSYLTNNELCVEIGCGTGVLTNYLVNVFQNVIGIELDKKMIEILKYKFSEIHNFQLIESDVLKIDFHDILKNKGKATLFGNLPYQLTSAIIRKICENHSFFENAYFLVQKEVAERIVAKAGCKDYGILSIASQVYAKTEILFKVSSSSFYPQPKVESAFVRLNFTESKYLNKICDIEFFFKIVKTAFAHRRKTLNNNFKVINNYQILKDKIDLSLRAEDLTIEDYIKIVDILKNEN